MRMRIALAAALAGLAAASVAHAHTSSSRGAPARLLVQGSEYRLQLSRGALRRGPAVIQFVNTVHFEQGVIEEALSMYYAAKEKKGSRS